MAGDRWAKLAVAAQAAGVLDYRQAESDSLKWLSKERILLDELECQRSSRIVEARLHMHACAVSAPSPSSAVYRHHFDAANGDLDVLRTLLLPYIKEKSTDKGSSARRTVDEMRKEWTRLFGDPSDPAVAADLSRLIAKMKKNRK